MAYSKETQRQNEALSDILAGRKTEKRVMVGYKGKEKEKGDIIPKMTEIMQDVRMPLFCKECNKVMKHRLDNKFWMKFGHCFDCQIKIENKLRIEGTFEEWQEEKIKQNKISFLKDCIEQIKEWKNMEAPEWFNNVGVNYPELEKEKWEMDTTQIGLMADEAIEEYTKILNKLENKE